MNSEQENSHLVSAKRIENSLNSQSSNADLEQFAAEVVEDLQAPLSSLTSFTALLADEYHNDLNENAFRYLEKINDSSVKMQAMLRDLETYARAGTSEQTWLTVDLDLILHQVIDCLQSKISVSHAEIIADNLPPILINPQEMKRVLENLIDNALKFNHNRPRIEITATKQQQEWLIAVADNGIGIAPEFQLAIFQAFQRLNSADTYAGNGLGLAICHKIINRYGGRIWVESDLDRGSTFFFTVPISIYPQIGAIAA